jgi:mannose-6-phosphate isomerase-like protein (cupin superfamily)
MFQPVVIEHKLLIDLSRNQYPTIVFGFNQHSLAEERYLRKVIFGENKDTIFGMVTDGTLRLNVRDGKGDGNKLALDKGSFFVVPGNTSFFGKAVALLILKLDYKGYFQIGGPLEERGRLKYIDGCSDTLLVSPPIAGEPCLNHLHIPRDINQTRHDHPSERIGVILRGSGFCRTPDGDYPLTPGIGWHIPAGQLHSFHTEADSLDVIAWHPESTFGPTHEQHPMLSRSYVNGISASNIPEIQTKVIEG